MKSYKEMFCDHWNEYGGLITQVYAAKILRKTPTRIRQMIKEKKLQGITIQDETPLVSLVEVIKYHNTQQDIKSEKYKDKYEELEKEEYEKWIEMQDPEELEKEKQWKKELQQRKKELQEKIEKIEDELEAVEKALNPTYEELQGETP